MPHLKKLKILFATYPEYYKQDFLDGLKSETSFSITEFTCCDVLYNLCSSVTKQANMKICLDILFKQHYKNIYLCTENYFSSILNYNKSMSINKQNIIDNSFGLIDSIYNDFQLYIIKHNNVNNYLDENPIRDFINNCKSENFRKLEYIIDTYVKDHDIILIPGTNQSVASPLICSLDLLNKIINNKEPLNKQYLADIVKNICGSENFDMMHNFFDTLIIMLIYKRAMKLNKIIISFCHGAQVGYAYYGGYINYSFRKENAGKWHTSKVKFGSDHMLHKIFNLKGFNNEGEYFNTVFMDAPRIENPLNKRLMTLTRNYTDVGILHASSNRSFVEYYNYNDIVYGLQIHIENSISSRSCIIDFIKNKVNKYNNMPTCLTKEHNPKIGPKIEFNKKLNQKDFFKGSYNDDEFQEFNFSIKTIPEII